MIKNKSETRHSDIFSYDFGQDDSKRKLGNLFVVGNVQNGQSDAASDPDGSGANSADITYIINLVASLAKREYYAKQDLTPKEAFSSALKKINGVIEEFFKNKDLKINIGIFAVAGENINISKLGKFKILMVRDGKMIDILNNINLFSKEVVQEKEFSHVISGKISANDKILAYYPELTFAARERTIKDSLLKDGRETFIDKIKAIKEKKDAFCCTALFVSLNKVKEPTSVPKIQPEELREKYATVATDAPVDNLNHRSVVLPSEDLPADRQAGQTDEEFIQPSEESPSQKLSVNLSKKQELNTAGQSSKDFPRIIPAEFSLGKKANPATVVYNKLRLFLPKPRNKSVFFAAMLVMAAIFTLTVKTIFIQSPEDKMANKAVNEAKSSLKLAKIKISQNDPVSARELLTASMLSLDAVENNSAAADAKDQVIKTLDGLDAAVQASLTLKDALPADRQTEFSLLTAETEKIKSGKYNLPSGMIDLNFYEGNVYILAANSIFKISDAGAANNTQPAAWLKSEVKLPDNPRLIAVDGNVYVLNKAGLLSVYFRGDQIGKFDTLILPEEKSKLLTTKDSKVLYLVNQTLGRIYLINKTVGTLEKTLVIGSSEPVENAFVGNDETLYIISKDSKIWEVR